MRLRALAAAACLVIAAFVPVPSSAQPPDRVRVDLVRDDTPPLALLMAMDAGIYGRENVEVILVRKNQSPDMRGPHVRLWHMGLPDVILSNRDAHDIRLFAITSRRLNGLAASIIALEEKRDILVRFLRATIEGNYLALTDEAGAKRILARDAGIKGARAVDGHYRDFRATTSADMDVSIAEVGAVLKANKINLSADAYVDDSLANELRKTQLYETLRKHYGTL